MNHFEACVQDSANAPLGDVLVASKSSRDAAFAASCIPRLFRFCEGRLQLVGAVACAGLRRLTGYQRLYMQSDGQEPS